MEKSCGHANEEDDYHQSGEEDHYCELEKQRPP